MPFPQHLDLAAGVESQDFQGTQNISVTMPASVNANDLLLIIISLDDDGTATTVLTPSGWTEQRQYTFDKIKAVVFSKQAAGTEGGTNVTVDLGRDVAAAVQVMQITGWNSIELGEVDRDLGLTTEVIPDLSPSWGAADTLWIPLAFASDDGANITSYPYTNNQLRTASGGGPNNDAIVGSCTDQINTASQTGLSYSIDAAQTMAVWMMAVEPGVKGGASDTTPPTLPADTTLSIATTKDSATVTYTKAPSDDVDPDNTGFVYRLWRAAKGVDISTAVLCNSNGTEEASGTDVAQLIDSAVPEAATEYEWNVTVEDTSGNQAAYTQNSAYTALAGVVTSDGATPVQGAVVRVIPADNHELANPGTPETLITDAQGEWELSAAYDPTKHYDISYRYLNIVDSGTLESATANTATDTDKAWTAGQWNDGTYVIFIPSTGELAVISDNTVDTVTINRDWGATPGAVSYEIGQLQSDESDQFPRKE